jgi:hypothetical protein
VPRPWKIGGDKATIKKSAEESCRDLNFGAETQEREKEKEAKKTDPAEAPAEGLASVPKVWKKRRKGAIIQWIVPTVGPRPEILGRHGTNAQLQNIKVSFFPLSHTPIPTPSLSQNLPLSTNATTFTSPPP